MNDHRVAGHALDEPTRQRRDGGEQVEGESGRGLYRVILRVRVRTVVVHLSGERSPIVAFAVFLHLLPLPEWRHRHRRVWTTST